MAPMLSASSPIQLCSSQLMMPASASWPPRYLSSPACKCGASPALHTHQRVDSQKGQKRSAHPQALAKNTIVVLAGRSCQVSARIIR